MSATTTEYSNGRFRCPRLNDANYLIWSNSVKVQMIADRCWKVINSPQPPPDRPAPVNGDTPESRIENRRLEREYRDDLDAYEQRSGAAAAIIRSTLTPIAESYVKGMTDPLTMWTTLRERLSPRDNVGRQQALRTEFDLLTFVDKEDINIYFDKLRDYQYNLEGTTLAITDAALVSKVLSTLPLTWRSQIRHLTDTGTATWASIEKSLRNIQAEQAVAKPASRAFAVSKRGGKRDKRRKTSGDNEKKSTRSSNPDIQCWYCARKGHTRDNCNFKKAADKLREKKDNKKPAAAAAASTNESSNESYAMMARRSFPGEPDDWFVDSGATDHMCFDKDSFTTYHSLDRPKPIYLGDSSVVNAYGVGLIRIGDRVSLFNVLHVPDLDINLLSVDKVLQQSYDVLFSGDGCTIRLGDKDIIEAVRAGNLFKINGKARKRVTLYSSVLSNLVGEIPPPAASPPDPIPSPPLPVGAQPLILWHQRLGHLNYYDLRRLLSLVDGIPITASQKSIDPGVCSPCLMGKHHKSYQRRIPAARTETPLALVHSDTCGPFRTPAVSGVKHFILFIDDFTRMTWVYFLKVKNHEETLEAFQTFKVIAEKASGHSICRFRCDNGRGEYDNQFFTDFLKAEGINYEPAAPYTQNQNGVSERKIRTVVERARTMLLEARLPERFWADAVATAVYILNRSPTKALTGKTPFEAWSGRRPNLSHLRRFGCDAYLHIPDAQRTKLKPKARRCTFLGYVPNTTKQWRLWDGRHQRVVIGSNVKFDENGFGNRQPEDPKMLEEISDAQTDQLSPSVPFGNRIVVETPPRDAAPPLPMSAASTPDAGYHSQHDEEELESGTVSPLTSLSPSPPLSPQSKYLDPFTPASPRSEAGYEDTIMLAPPPGANYASGKPANTGKMISRAFSARSDNEPQSYKEAMAASTKWHAAIKSELDSHIENGTWEPGELPPGRREISSKWVFKTKVNADGSLRYKARLVVRGFEQREGLDYQETFAPVAKFPTLRVLLALAAHYDWEIHQMDVKTAFLYPELKETVYMTPPEGYGEFLPDHKPIPKMLRLLKCLYGLKQAPYEWYNDIDEFLRSAGFLRSNQDHNLYLSQESILLLYVDDILIFGRSLCDVTALKKKLSKKYSMVDLGEAKQYLGMHIERDRHARTIFLNQTRYITKVLERFCMQKCKGISTPMDAAPLPPCPPYDDAVKRVEYQSKVGNIMYAMLGTRPDLAYAVSALSKYNSCPITAHHSAMGRVLRYLQSTKNMGILYKGEPNSTSAMPELVCYTDSDWGGDRDKRRSTGGFVLTLCGGAVSWKTRKQDVVALSTTEAEYIALTEASKEVIWMRRLLHEIETRDIESSSTDIRQSHDESTNQWENTEDSELTPLPMPATTIFVDNQGAMKLADNPQFHNRTKHIDIRYHFIRDTLAAGETALQYLPTADMVADILTKPLPRQKHEKHSGAMGLHSASAKKTFGDSGNEDFIMVD
jgi:hypothetical protein